MLVSDAPDGGLLKWHRYLCEDLIRVGRDLIIFGKIQNGTDPIDIAIHIAMSSTPSRPNGL